MANISGTDNRDTLSGTIGDDVIDAMGGNDLIIGSLGKDSIYGGAGSDTVDYSALNLSIDVQLIDATGFVAVGFDYQQLLFDVENVIGGNQVDHFSGNSGDNVFVGAGGDDLFTASLGKDIYFGDDGFDSIDYSSIKFGVYIDRAGPNQLATFVNGVPVDRLFSVEEILGSTFDDVIKGTRANENFEGFGGEDHLFGRGGRDTLYGAQGDDILTGGKGADTFVFAGESGNDVVTDFKTRGLNHDIVDIHSIPTITSFDDLIKNHMTQNDDGVLIDAGLYGTILLEGVSLNKLSPDQFLIWTG